ncbi:MAG: allantoin permease [Castellaniella sp.]|uniref:purine-cytosine permease family protein n=1 Tax=Castellaniella sp. TaxID=1955812 RepID=UPI00120CA637|nr:cytosine permease [Castellaniella sp.]TAN27689.1 MAG: allantoin permease [Castellaniella sp.]
MSSSVSSPSSDTIPAAERVFSWRDHTSLWFSLGVGLLVIQVGAYLVPALGTRDALSAVIAGSVVGAGLLAWVARIGCENGLSSAGLIHVVYGHRFARLPVLLNVIQLLGWATFELVVMRDGTRAIGRQAFGMDPGLVLPTLLWGLIVMALLRGSMVTLVRRIVSRAGLPLVILSLLWLSAQFALKLDTQGLHALWQRAGDGSMNTFQALDLVIAMPVSWLPLVADYARHGKSARGALGGTWLGYTIANIWCYALGVLVITVTGPNVDMVSALLLAQGGLLALGLILIDELDNTYGDLYSGSVCTQSLLPSISVRTWSTILAAASIAFAMVLPMHSLEPFLLTLSSVFVPLFGVILGRLGTHPNQQPNAPRAIHTAPALIWVLGIACYQVLAQWAPQYGSALPTLLLTFVLGAASARFGARATRAATQ